MSQTSRVRDKGSLASWRDTLLRVLKEWNRHQVWKILTAVVVTWIVSGTALHLAERDTNPAFETLERVPLERLGHPVQRTRNQDQLFCRAVRGCGRACRRCRLGRVVYGQRGVDPDRTRTKE